MHVRIPTRVLMLLAGSLALGAAPVGSAAGEEVLYVSNFVQNLIYKISPGGVVSTFASTGLDAPQGLAFDRQGNLFVANSGNDTISRITPNGQVSTFVSSGLDYPIDLAFDNAGNLYVSNGRNNTVSRITPAGVVNTFASADLFVPGGLAFDSSGNLYVGNTGAQSPSVPYESVTKITPSGSVSTYFPTLPEYNVLAFDRSGALYGAISGDDTIDVATLSPTVRFGVFKEFPPPQEVDTFAFDSGGNLIVASGGSLLQVTPDGSTRVIATGLVDPAGIVDPQVMLPVPEPGGGLLCFLAVLLVLQRRSRRGSPAGHRSFHG